MQVRRGCSLEAGLLRKAAIQQAFTLGSLRGWKGQRNAAAKLCTAKQLLGAQRRWTRQNQVLSTLYAASALFLARVAHATKHLNSDGFQS